MSRLFSCCRRFSSSSCSLSCSRSCCVLRPVSLTQRIFPLAFCPLSLQKLVALSPHANWALTLCWQAMTATSAAGSEELLCLNELPAWVPHLWYQFSRFHLPTHLRTDFFPLPLTAFSVLLGSLFKIRLQYFFFLQFRARIFVLNVHKIMNTAWRGCSV